LPHPHYYTHITTHHSHQSNPSRLITHTQRGKGRARGREREGKRERGSGRERGIGREREESGREREREGGRKREQPSKKSPEKKISTDKKKVRHVSADMQGNKLFVKGTKLCCSPPCPFLADQRVVPTMSLTCP